MATTQEQFYTIIKQLTEALNGQYPRPWMTELDDPLAANVFIVGMNQANDYDSSRISHERHLNALFNRAGESCRRVYDELTGFTPSPTRQNTDRFRRMLASEGVTHVLETNVVCYSTPMSSDLRFPQHRGGTVRGSEIFQSLLHFVKPRVLIAHGAGTRKALAKLLKVPLPAPPKTDVNPHATLVGDMRIYIIPSLAPPQWNKWHDWAEQHLAKVAKSVASAL